MAEISFELYNNALVQQMVGAQDANLKSLEKILGVEIVSFGNTITVKGDKNAVFHHRLPVHIVLFVNRTRFHAFQRNLRFLFRVFVGK